MGCCYGKDDLESINKSKYYMGEVMEEKEKEVQKVEEPNNLENEGDQIDSTAKNSEGGVREPLLDNKVYPGQIKSFRS